jgi:hypothetical protein
VILMPTYFFHDLVVVLNQTLESPLKTPCNSNRLILQR